MGIVIYTYFGWRKSKMRVVSIGEVLWDMIEGEAFLGGAPLNVCANLQRCGDEAFLISAVGNDSLGAATHKTMTGLKLSKTFLGQASTLPTGTAVVSRDADGEPCFLIERPAAFDAIKLEPAKRTELSDLRPDWIYMGTLLQTFPEAEELIRNLRAELSQARCFYDMNLREGHWSLPLVERLCAGVNVLKLNEVEAATLSRLNGVEPKDFTLESFCCGWSERFGIAVICVTLGAEGCCVYSGEGFASYRGRQITVSDTVGAGDAFAAAFLHGYQLGWPIAKCAAIANSLGAFVASRRGATPAWTLAELEPAFT
jgi:fructokinase